MVTGNSVHSQRYLLTKNTHSDRCTDMVYNPIHFKRQVLVMNKHVTNVTSFHGKNTNLPTGQTDKGISKYPEFCANIKI